MNEYKWLFLAVLSLFSLVANYLINKALSINYSPFLTLTVTGLFQAVICFLFFLFSNESILKFSTSNIFLSMLVALCVIGIDYGMITAYKFGGNSVAITLIVSMATVVILPISYFVFKEALTKVQLFGIFLSVISIILVVGFPKK